MTATSAPARRVRPGVVLGRALPHLLLVAFVTWLGRRLLAGTFGYGVFADRELWRGMRWWEDLPVTGAEINGATAARVPGGFLEVLFALPRLVAPHAGAVYGLQVALELASVVVLYVAAARRFGAVAGLLTAFVWGTTAAQLDAMRQVWNPGMLPLFVAVATAGLLRVVVDRDGRGLLVLAAGLALGAQIHLGMTGLLVAAVPAVALARPRRLGAGLAGAALIVALAYAPFVVSELRHGWPATHALLASGADTAGRPWILRFRETLQVLGGWPALGEPFVGTRGQQHVLALPAWAALAVGWLALVRVSARATRTDDARALAALALVVLVGAAAVAQGTVTARVGSRYVVPLLGVLATLAGVGTARALAWARGRHPALAVVGAGLVAGALWPRLPVVAAPNAPGGYGPLLEVLAAVRRETGWSLRDMVGRTTWSTERPGTTFPWDTWVPVEHLLAARGDVFPGSLPPPCALLVAELPRDPDGGPWTPARVVDAFAPNRLPLVGTPVATPLPHGWTLIRYDRAGALCPTTMTQRYVESPVERQLHDVADELVPGVARELPAARGRRFAVVPAPEGLTVRPVTLALDVDATVDALTLRLASPQLRGTADNDHGWTGTGAVLRPTVIATRTAGGPPERRELVLYEDVVGPHAALAPIARRFPPLGAGTWTLDLSLDVIPWRHGMARPPDVTLGRPWTGTLVADLAAP